MDAEKREPVPEAQLVTPRDRYESDTLPRADLTAAFTKCITNYVLSANSSESNFEADELAQELADEVPVSVYWPVLPEDTGIIFFNQEIDNESALALNQKLIQVHLNAPLKVPITLYLSSQGGGIFAGMEVVSTIFELQRRKRIVNVHVQGCALSMASLILQAANHRSMDRSAYLMLHELASGFQGKLSAQKDEIEFNKRLETTLLEIYSARTGKSTSYFAEKTRKKDWYLSSDEALKENLVDEVTPWPLFKYTKPAAVKRLRKKLSAVQTPLTSEPISQEPHSG